MIYMTFSVKIHKILPVSNVIYPWINRVSFERFETCPRTFGTDLVYTVVVSGSDFIKN